MSLDKIARALLPEPLYLRLKGSPVAKRIAKGTLWSVAGTAASRVLVLVAMILVARALGKVSFGEFGLVQATLGVAGLMAGLGLGSTATRFVAQFAGTDQMRAGRVIALVTQTTWIAVLLTAGVLILASAPIAAHVLDAAHLQSALVWGALLMAANVIRGVQSGFLAGLERFDLTARLNVIEGLISLLAMVALAHYMGVEGALLGLAIGGLAAWFVGERAMKSELEKRDIRPLHRGCWQEWKILSGYSLPSLLANLVATPVLWLCMTLLAHQPDGYAQLGIYNAAYQWHGPMIFIPMAIMSASLPALVQEWESGDRERFRKVTLWVAGLTLAIAVPPVLLVGLLSPWVMSFYGAGFREGWLALVLILAAAPLHALAKIATASLLSMNRAWIVLKVNLLWSISMLLLTSWLVPTNGLIGLVLSFLFAYAILAVSSLWMVLSIPRSICRNETDVAMQEVDIT